MSKKKTLREKFDDAGYSVESNGCWRWSGSFRTNGYGSIGRNGKAHRASYELFKGPIPRGMDVCHSCDNRACVNPDRLFVGTRTDNMRDCKAKGRTARTRRPGETNPAAKLTAENVTQIRTSYSGKRGEQRTLAARYGVTQSAIYLIVHRKNWREVA